MGGSTTRKQRVLVVGWGLIGAAAGVQLRAGNTAVVGFTRSETVRTRMARNAGIDVIIAGADDRVSLEDALTDVSHVLYTAGGLLPPSASADPVADANATLSPLIHTLQAVAARPGITMTLISSGGTVYGNPARLPVRETDPLLPISPYGASRLASEMYAQTYARAFGTRVRVVRCANVYGPGQPADRGQGAVAVFLHRVSSGLPVEIVGNGSTVRDYVYIDDVATALAHLIQEDIEFDAVNVGCGTGHSVTELLEKVATVVGRSPVIDYRPARAHDVRAIVLDIGKLQSLIDYSPTTLDEGLRRTWEARETVEAASPARFR